MITNDLSADGLRSDFLTLLVTQLRHQDPLEPVKQDEFVSQLAQFSTVEGIEKLNVQFNNVLYMQQVLSGFDLVDKTVQFIPPGGLEPQTGTVSQVFIDSGEIKAVVNGQTVGIRDVVGVVGESAAVLA